MVTIIISGTRRKEIDLSPDTYVTLSSAATASGKTLKEFIEDILADYSALIRSNSPGFTERLREVLRESRQIEDFAKLLPRI